MEPRPPKKPTNWRFFTALWRGSGRLLKAGIIIAVVLLGAFWLLWAFGAVWYFKFLGDFRYAAAVLLPVAVVGCLFLKPRRYFLPAIPGLLLLVSLVFALLRPSNDRDWQPEYGRMPHVEYLDETQLLIHDIRDFHYRSETDFDVCYRTQRFDLAELEAVDFIVVHWDNMEAIGHTMLSFRFSDGERLVFSAETRRDTGDIYGAIPGLYKQFELITIIGTEKDLLELRTNYRREEVFLYPTTSSREDAKKIFLSLLNEVNSLYEQPRFYHTLTFNCTTSLLPSIREAVKLPLRDPTFLCNGFTDWLGFSVGWLKLDSPDQTFPDLKLKRFVNPRVDRLDDPTDYSELIRQPLVLPPALNEANDALQKGRPPYAVVALYDDNGEITGLLYRYYRYPVEEAIADFTALWGPPVEAERKDKHRRLCWESGDLEIELIGRHASRFQLKISLE